MGDETPAQIITAQDHAESSNRAPWKFGNVWWVSCSVEPGKDREESHQGSLPVCTWAEPWIEDFILQRWEEMADEDMEEHRWGRGCGDEQEQNARSEHAQSVHTEAGTLWLWGSDFEEPVCSSTDNWGTEEFSVCQELTNLFYRKVILCVVQETWERRVDNGGSTTDLATAIVLFKW